MQADFFHPAETLTKPVVHFELPFRVAKEDQSPFAKELVQEVHGFFKSTNKSFKADRWQKFKIALILTQVSATYLALVFAPLSTPWVLLLLAYMIFWISMWGFNLGHEAAHNTVFKNHWASELFRISFDVIGISSAVFRRKHLFFHHQHTNQRGIDGDMEDAYPLARLSNYYDWRPYHRYQLWYILPAYSLLTLVWIWYDDWKRVANNKVAAAEMIPLTGFEKVWFILLKLLSVFIFLGIPSFFHPFWIVLACYIAAHLGAGVIAGLIFQIAHINKNCEALADYKFSSWYQDQVQQTRNFATHNAFANWFFGGLNFQIEHHLFSYISSCHYPTIQKIVKRVCQKHGVAYLEAPSFFQAVVDHLKTIHVLGQPGSPKQQLSSEPLV
jgi:linoleoyl-CoA desaturase